MKPLMAIGLALMAAQVARGQERVDVPVIADSIPPDQTGEIAPAPRAYAPRLTLSSNSFAGAYATYSAPDLTVPLASSLPAWLTFTADEQAYPGLMHMQSGSMGIASAIGNLDYAAYAGAVKYASFNSLTTAYYVGGVAGYQFSPTLRLTLFGAYYSRNPYLGMAAYPYVPTTNYGGYVTIAPSSTFSLALGAKTYYDPFARTMQVDPIIAPTLKVGKVKVGIDVGHGVKQYLLHRLTHR